MGRILSVLVKPVIAGVFLGIIFSTFILADDNSPLNLSWFSKLLDYRKTQPLSPLAPNEVPSLPAPRSLNEVGSKDEVGLTSTEVVFLKPTKSPKDFVLPAQGGKQLTEITGFLPYWKLGQVKIPFERLTSIAFFGIPIDKHGRIAKLDKDGNENPGWTKYKSTEFDNLVTTAHQNGAKLFLVLEIMNNDDITAVINNPLARKNTRENILDLVRQKNLDGINIDIEYQGIPEASTIKNFTVFVSEFRDFLTRSGTNIPLTLDVHADSVVKTRLFELDKLAPYLDRIIIMGYDFFRPNSGNSGPVAPLLGKERFEYDVTTAVTDFLKFVPPEKLILGIPFYGYEWQTETAEAYSKTVPNTGALATYGRIKKIINDRNLTPEWDEFSQEPYLIFEEKGTIHQIFYEDSTSLAKKIDLVKKASLVGIAIWALGYEGEFPDLWQAIK